MPKKPACDSCHRKKITCDRGRPRCEWCQHRNFTCTYDRLKEKSAAAAATQTPGARIRSRNAAGRTRDRAPSRPSRRAVVPQQQLSPPDDVAESRAGSAIDHADNDCIFYGGLQFAGADLGEISSRCGIPVFPEGGRRWIQNQTGIDAIFPRVYDQPHVETQPLSPEAVSMLLRPDEIIPRRDLESWIKNFLASPLSSVFPVISSELFSQTVQKVYVPVELTKASVVSARACTLAFAAMLFRLDPEQTPGLRSDDVVAYVTAVEQTLLPSLAVPTLDGLQTALFLVIYHQLSGSLQSAAMLHALACRCVIALKGHIKKSEVDALSEEQHYRRLFWLCYFIDKDITLRTGQSPVLSETELDLQLPDGYDFYSLPLDGSEIAPQGTRYFSDLRLTKMKSKICTVLWSKAAEAKTNAQLIADIMTMDAELETWRLSVPEQFRPQLSTISTVIQGQMHHSAKMLVICSHLEYFFLLAAVHRASGQRRKWRSGVPLELGALKSSMQVTIEASRSTLQLLKTGLWDIHKESFWLFSFYPIWAAMTIFCYVLYEPTSHTVRADLDLLRQVPRLIRSLPASGLDAAQEAHLKSLNAFLDELPRLGNLALAKAKKSCPSERPEASTRSLLSP